MHTDEAVAQEERPTRETPRGTETVLLVEDDELTRNVTGLVLEELGYRLLEAENGTQAVEMNRTFAGRSIFS